MQTNLTVSQAERVVLQTVAAWPAERVPLSSATGCILRQNVLAERDLPPYDRATMDGIALRWKSWASGQREFRLEGLQSAGQPPGTLADPQATWRIATGAALPAGADTVVPVEKIVAASNAVRIVDNYRPERSQFIHKRGSDRRAGALLLKAGQPIGGVEMALLSANGVAQALSRPGSADCPDLHRRRAGGLRRPARSRGKSAPAMAPPWPLLLQRNGYSNVKATHAPDDPEPCSRSASKRPLPKATP